MIDWIARMVPRLLRPRKDRTAELSAVAGEIRDAADTVKTNASAINKSPDVLASLTHSMRNALVAKTLATLAPDADGAEDNGNVSHS